MKILEHRIHFDMKKSFVMFRTSYKATYQQIVQGADWLQAMITALRDYVWIASDEILHLNISPSEMY